MDFRKVKNIDELEDQFQEYIAPYTSEEDDDEEGEGKISLSFPNLHTNYMLILFLRPYTMYRSWITWKLFLKICMLWNTINMEPMEPRIKCAWLNESTNRRSSNVHDYIIAYFCTDV